MVDDEVDDGSREESSQSRKVGLSSGRHVSGLKSWHDDCVCSTHKLGQKEPQHLRQSSSTHQAPPRPPYSDCTITTLKHTVIHVEKTSTSLTAIMADSVCHPQPHVHSRNPLFSTATSPELHHSVQEYKKGRSSLNIANMMEIQADLAERKPRKSVAFSEGATIVDSDGQVTESKEVNGGKSTAESHSGGPSTPPTGQEAYTNKGTDELTGAITDAADKEVEEVTDMFADLAKKVCLHMND